MRGRSLGVALSAALAVTGGVAVLTAAPASAAAGCRVGYAVSSSWPGGFGANVTITNLGDPLSSWTLVWTYGNGQTVTQAWNTSLTQSGSTVTARNVSWNGALATNGTASFGFNGSASGTNSVPTAFTLNGTACTGTITPTTPPATTPPPSTGGVPSDAAWVDSGQWASWTNNGYTLYNNIWGSGAGSQTIWARSGTNWGVVANHPRTSGVKSYPNTGKTLNRTLSSLKSVSSSFNVSVPADGDYSTTYDIWANNHAYEVMIWTNQHGAVGPIAEQYDANGAVPNVRNLSVGGHTWNVYRGSNGANAVFSFIRTNTSSGTIDLLAVLNWLRTNAWWGDVTVGELQFGFEISGTAGQSNFTTNSFSLSYS
ncbi:cellulose binding domain-containing protein [Actinoplanes bogorensis]|uniref:Cellulose binding domain-containing protein n=1 Tax=Paractinoplanes bogorensis TaxID=1610840 RepID=A0ABS5YKV8_9ACTN|nr:cellulose binding domain-containing protein [Actinoplanes bogorensis]MBU2664109.1 cellulose binding domain-containing protein [Actinoplanes bogorensis]